MAKSLREELDDFLHLLCVREGFCSMPEEDRLKVICASHLTADEFALAVLKGDGFPEPEAEVGWLRTLKRLFVERFGSTSITAEEFESDE